MTAVQGSNDVHLSWKRGGVVGKAGGVKGWRGEWRQYGKIGGTQGSVSVIKGRGEGLPLKTTTRRMRGSFP